MSTTIIKIEPFRSESKITNLKMKGNESKIYDLETNNRSFLCPNRFENNAGRSINVHEFIVVVSTII